MSPKSDDLNKAFKRVLAEIWNEHTKKPAGEIAITLKHVKGSTKVEISATWWNLKTVIQRDYSDLMASKDEVLTSSIRTCIEVLNNKSNEAKSPGPFSEKELIGEAKKFMGEIDRQPPNLRRFAFYKNLSADDKTQVATMLAEFGERIGEMKTYNEIKIDTRPKVKAVPHAKAS